MKEEEELLLVQERRQREKRKWELDQEEHNKKMCLYDAVLDLIQVGSFGHNIISKVSVRTVSVWAQQTAFVAVLCVLHHSLTFYLVEIHIFYVVTEHSTRIIEEEA